MDETQRAHWKSVYRAEPGKFGLQPSEAGLRAERLFGTVRAHNILELGCGPGRDALYFARLGYSVTALDYAQEALGELERRANAEKLGERLRVLTVDQRHGLPFESNSFDACFSHMNMCMAFTENELRGIMHEVLRVLVPGGLHIYTVRTMDDPDFGQGKHIFGDVYEVEGYRVHFFNREKVERLAEGYRLESIEAFEEGDLPKRLLFVVMRKREPVLA